MYVIYLSKEMAFVLENGVEVSVHANTIREHLLLVIKKGVGAEIVGKIDTLVNGGAATIAACRTVSGNAIN